MIRQSLGLKDYFDKIRAGFHKQRFTLSVGHVFYCQYEMMTSFDKSVVLKSHQAEQCSFANHLIMSLNLLQSIMRQYDRYGSNIYQFITGQLEYNNQEYINNS